MAKTRAFTISYVLDEKQDMLDRVWFSLRESLQGCRYAEAVCSAASWPKFELVCEMERGWTCCE